VFLIGIARLVLILVVVVVDTLLAGVALLAAFLNLTPQAQAYYRKLEEKRLTPAQ